MSQCDTEEGGTPSKRAKSMEDCLGNEATGWDKNFSYGIQTSTISFKNNPEAMLCGGLPPWLTQWAML